MAPESGIELRLLRTFVVVAEQRSFTRAADELNIAQQAVSQQIKALERALGVTLLRRTSRQVALTREGVVFMADSRRVLAAAESASRRVRAAAHGEAGTLRLAYTFMTAWETVPMLLARMEERYPQVRIETREVRGGDLEELLLRERFDVAVAPRTSYPKGFLSRAVRRERLGIAISKTDGLARRKRIELASLADRLFEIWPREMAPGLYDTILSSCRAAGFDPKIDEQATGNTVWRNLARGRGVVLIPASVIELAPRAVAFVELAPPGATVTYDAVWHNDGLALTSRLVEAASELAKEYGWL